MTEAEKRMLTTPLAPERRLHPLLERKRTGGQRESHATRVTRTEASGA
jgi:hypothetical protein